MTASLPEQDSVADIARLLERLGRSAYGDGFSAGLNPAQWAALRYFHAANRFSRTISAFAGYHGTTLGTASQTVKSMVDKGFLRRQADPRDRRRQQISVSRSGSELLRSDPLAVLAEAANALPASRREAMAEAMRAMLGTIAEQRGNPCFGICANCSYLVGKRADASRCCKLVDEQLQPEELDQVCINFEPAAR